MTKNQITALLFVIYSAKFLKDFEKKLMIYMIENTNGLKESVRVFFEPGKNFPESFYDKEVAMSCHFLSSSSSEINFNAILKACGTNLYFSFCGNAGDPKNWEVFLAKSFADRKARLLRPKRKTIEDINLILYRVSYEDIL